MKISHIHFWHLEAPLTTRYGDANGLKSRRTSQIIRIETDAGLVGWGETFGYRVSYPLWAEIDDLLRGAEVDAVTALVDRVAALDLRLAGGIDIALWDIKGKRAGLPLASLFGGARRSAQPTYASLQNVSEAADITGAALAEAARAFELGFTSLKMKIGWHPVTTDIGWVNAVIEALPPGAVIALDANRAMDLRAALTFVRGLARPDRVSWFEEPLANTAIAPHLDLRAAIDIPVAGAESMPLPVIQEVIARQAMDIINPDLAGHGGFAPLGRLATLADAAGMRMVPHIFDGQLVRVATLHFLAARPGWAERQAAYAATPLEYDISPNPLRDDLLAAPLALDSNGHVPMPAGPGLGVEIDQTVLERFAVARH